MSLLRLQLLASLFVVALIIGFVLRRADEFFGFGTLLSVMIYIAVTIPILLLYRYLLRLESDWRKK